MVVVLMSTYNGGKYLQEQLHSLMQQKNVEFEILVRDDGSTDSTCDILNEWQNKGLLTWYKGENKGPAYSFLDLIYKAPDADYYAFCDQDDVWSPEKLQVAVNSLCVERAALYFSQTQMVDANLNPIKTPVLNPKIVIEEAVINYYVTGCTVVFNRRLRSYVKEYRPSFIVMHDLWCYLICLCVGGEIVYDPCPHIYYRQHSDNVVGLKRGLVKEWKRRIVNCFLSKERLRSRTVNELLLGYGKYLPENKRKFLFMIQSYRNNTLSCFKLLFSSKVMPINITRNLLFRISVLLRIF